MAARRAPLGRNAVRGMRCRHAGCLCQCAQRAGAGCAQGASRPVCRGGPRQLPSRARHCGGSKNSQRRFPGAPSGRRTGRQRHAAVGGQPCPAPGRRPQHLPGHAAVHRAGSPVRAHGNLYL
ncbi:hypothetical protein G6F63_016411 [Rhizopus arrhizus]|nr:hypothetical protein G6F63_016411 [Rhizopus arrhizus]